MSVIPIEQAQPAATVAAPGVYLLTVETLQKHRPPWLIDDRPVRAIAPHPDRDDLLYLTVEHPETLAFLPDPYVEF